MGFTREKIELPGERIRTVRSEIWVQLRSRDSLAAEEAYADLLHAISHPAAIARGRMVHGTTVLQYSLNLLIFLSRLFWPAVLLLIIMAIVHSWLYLIALPVLITWEFFVLNTLQTRINVELAARLLVLDEHLEDVDGSD